MLEAGLLTRGEFRVPCAQGDRTHSAVSKIGRLHIGVVTLTTESWGRPVTAAGFLGILTGTGSPW
jgi:hypothetical protein